jgi:perosamine synthetase
MVVSSSPELGERMRLAGDKCYSRKPGGAVRNASFLANNYRMTELQSAVALAQLRKLDSIVSRRQRWCAALSERLRGVEGITLPRPSPGCEPAWWFYLLRVAPERLHATADEFAAALQSEGLPAGAHYINEPVYCSPLFANHSAFARGEHPFSATEYGPGLCPTAEAILETAVLLSANEAYTQQDLDETVLAISRTAAWFRQGK